jgi:predicted dehydrogenase
MKKIKIGLAGGGTIHDFHMYAYNRIPEVEVVAVCALPKDVKPFAEKWRISKTFTEIENLCKEPEIDVIDIGLPPFLHSKAVALAAEEHKAVLCEKPLARNAEEAGEMVSAVEKYGVFNAYLENYSFFSWVEEAKRCLENGAIGKPVWMRFYEGNSGPSSPWCFKPELSGGGCLMDLGCHSIEALRWLLGKKNPIQAFGWIDSLVNKQAIETGVEDYCLALVKYDETMSQCESSWGVISPGNRVKLEIIGTEGTFSIGACPRVEIFSTASDTQILKRLMDVPGVDKGWFFSGVVMAEYLQAMVSQMQHIVASYLQDKAPRHKLKDGLIVNKIIGAVYKSAESGKWEKI